MVLRRSLWELEKRYCILLFDLNVTELITTHPLLHDDHSVVLVQVRSYEITCCLMKEERVPCVYHQVVITRTCTEHRSVFPHRTLLFCQTLHVCT